MIDVSALAKLAGTGATSVMATVGASYLLFTPQDDFNQHVAKSERGYILEVVEQARREPPGAFKDSLCKTLSEAIAELCASAKDDAICVDRAMWIERAGC